VPGPACYGRGGTFATVTDADLMLGKIDAARFAGGRIRLDAGLSERALTAAVGTPLGLDAVSSAHGVVEIVDENMANAARVHAVERGLIVTDHTLVAFGGAAPLHACRLAEKLGLARVIVPADAGVGSAIGFLSAPAAYELVRSRSRSFCRSVRSKRPMRRRSALPSKPSTGDCSNASYRVPRSRS
jgi:N-methylhydantoinase A